MKMRLFETDSYRAPKEPELVAIETPDHMILRAALWRPATSPRGSIVLMQGRAEFIERYFETIGEWLERGFVVLAFDWRGQGGSTRLLPNRAKGHVATFDHYVSDLQAVLKEMTPHLPRPLIGQGVSMGGMVLLSALVADPDLFDAAILISPMLGISAARRGSGTRLLAATLVRMGLSRSFAPGQRVPGRLTKPFEFNLLSRDQRRFERNMELVRTTPELGIGAPTVGWVHAALQRIDWMAQTATASRITTPVLALAPERDRVTFTPETEQFCRHLPHARFVAIPDAEHELLMETDQVRATLWSEVDAFLDNVIGETRVSASQAL